MRFDIITIFPGIFAGIFEHGVVKRAIAGGLVAVKAHDLREFTHDRHRTVDGRPFGGGEGMVLKPEPLAEALESLGVAPKDQRDARRESVVLLSAQGRKFTQETARELARLDHIILICGRYEGVDERVNELLADRELSIGDYVLSGGELGAAVIIDATMRLLPGVLGNDASNQFESFGSSDADLTEAGRGDDPLFHNSTPRSTHGAGGLLDYPHYTRPSEFRGLTVPEVLSGGNHEQIRRWRRERAIEKTFRNRPDLLENAELSEQDKRFLHTLRTSR
ncbi:tRNA (Guanine37-N1) -methyltransferase [Acidisarcina polymorpha]|uniref:tRNA (guanine-N(1)-)-methyltransferase n=1 Tax=Acidisarcina polymorpha TaxID=2211140 RepID=A0A2Z5G6P8_9BACT|nr:tRNA (guanosine(37)-N1)-methyltransferase TrmD [Acidisarcina polymorpha]AXC14325.1 tRNA (Guanine37-N1) -methyltransferase [Acidisarcina polymorpha]